VVVVQTQYLHRVFKHKSVLVRVLCKSAKLLETKRSWTSNDRLLMRDTVNSPWLLTNRQFQTYGQHNFSPFDIDLWPTTLKYNPRLAKVKVNPYAKNQGHRSNDSNRRAPTNGRTDAAKHYRPWYVVDKNTI